MDRPAFVAILSPLLLASRVEFDLPTWGAYFRVLEDVAPGVLELAVETVMREAREFFPKAGELRSLCEKARRQVVAAHPWSACCECEDSPKWRAILIDGIPRVEKCPCVERHRVRLGEMGILEPIAPLAGEPSGESEQVYPTLAQLPAPIRERLQIVAGQKVLR